MSDSELLLRRVKREISLLRDDVEEIGIVEDGMSIGDMLKELKDVDGLVDELIVNCFMGDDDE